MDWLRACAQNFGLFAGGFTLVGVAIAYAGGAIAKTVFEETVGNHTRSVVRRTLRRIDSKLRGGARHASSLGQIDFGGLVIPWEVLTVGPFAPERIRVRESARRTPLPPGLRDAYQNLEDEVEHPRGGNHPRLFNGKTYQLTAFEVGARDVLDGVSVPTLRLYFGYTDYFTHLVTDMNVDSPIRNSLRAEVDVTTRPVPQFASIVGVELMVVTRDGELVIARRSATTKVRAGAFASSVSGGLSYPVDDANPTRAIIREASEELAIAVDASQIEYVAFGVDLRYCEYTLVAWCQTDRSANEIERERRLGVPVDKWENSSLEFLPCRPEGVAQYVRETGPENWYPPTLIGLRRTLERFGGYSHSEVDRVFKVGPRASR